MLMKPQYDETKYGILVCCLFYIDTYIGKVSMSSKAKAARKMLVEMTINVNFISILKLSLHIKAIFLYLLSVHACVFLSKE